VEDSTSKWRSPILWCQPAPVGSAALPSAFIWAMQPMSTDDDETEPDRDVSWEEIHRTMPSDRWSTAAYGRLQDLERMLLHVCAARGVSEQTVMDALGTETTPEHVHDETFVPITIDDDDDDLLYIAFVGRAIAAMGGHLELRAVFPDQEFLLLSEPGPQHMDDDISGTRQRFNKRR
jgi:hypothetical protein